MFPMRRAVVRRRPLLRAAAVGGGAYLAGRAMTSRSNQRAQEEASQSERPSGLEQPQAARYVPRQAPEPAPAQPDLYDQLRQVSALHERGELTDEEFSAAKARLLG